MGKLKLDIDELEVESFAITSPAGSEGTVHGRRVEPGHPIHPPSEFCEGGGGGATDGTCIGPTYCCATGPTNHVCIGPTFCCNPTANTGCCPPPTNGCPPTAYVETCGLSCDPRDCVG